MKEKLLKIILEFRTFSSRGNVIDLAVGVVIGGAFTKLVDGVVKGVIEPTIGVVTGQGSTEAIVVGLLNFGGGLLNFLMLAAVVFFIFVKPLNKLKELAAAKEQKAEAEAPKVKPPTQEELLAEIRDILRQQKGAGA